MENLKHRFVIGRFRKLTNEAIRNENFKFPKLTRCLSSKKKNSPQFLILIISDLIFFFRRKLLNTDFVKNQYFEKTKHASEYLPRWAKPLKKYLKFCSFFFTAVTFYLQENLDPMSRFKNREIYHPPLVLHNFRLIDNPTKSIILAN